MRKQRDILYGIVLYLCITTILSFLIRLNLIFVEWLDISPYFSLVGNIALYALFFYVLCELPSFIRTILNE